MFSPRLLAVFAFVAFAAALPTSDRPAVPIPITTITEDDVDTPWFSFPLFGNFFAPLWQLFPKFTDIGPKIIAEDDKFEIIVNVKGYKKEDLKVKVKGDFVFIQGTQEAKQDERDVFASHFLHTYTLPTNFSAASVVAELTSDEYLIVKAAPGAGDNTKEADRVVTIVSTDKPYKEAKQPEDKTSSEESSDDKTDLTRLADKVEKVENPPTPTPTPAAPTTTAVTEEDRKESTTPAAERGDVTEKDNVIPHGNEIQP